MKNRIVSNEDTIKINDVLTAAGYEKATRLSLEEATETDAILRYVPNCDDHDAAMGRSALYNAGLQINYDGDSSTTEEGMDQDTIPPTCVIMVKLPMWKTE